MSETESQQADETNGYKITSDNVECKPGNGVERQRTVVVDPPAGSKRQAEFSFDADTRTYLLEEYGKPTSPQQVLALGITFGQADVDALQYLAGYVAGTRDDVDVELFVGEGQA